MCAACGNEAELTRWNSERPPGYLHLKINEPLSLRRNWIQVEKKRCAWLAFVFAFSFRFSLLGLGSFPLPSSSWAWGGVWGDGGRGKGKGKGGKGKGIKSVAFSI